MGTKYELTPTIVSEGLKLHREDCLLLCTDGFWEYIPDDLISKLTNRIKLASETILDDYFQKVIEIGKVKTAKYDNLTTQLIMVK